MINPKDILVTTTSSLDGIEVIQYLKPISAHVVAGTNFFTDFMAGMSDIFGGRSGAYQRQLVSLYNEAIEKLRVSAYEIGANCILGLKIDMDEISGKNKSMFMLTAVGTAVKIDPGTMKNGGSEPQEKYENIDVDRLKILLQKKSIISEANDGTLKMTEDTWVFITNHQVDEVFDHVIKRWANALEKVQEMPDAYKLFYNSLAMYINSLPEDKRTTLVYQAIAASTNSKLTLALCVLVETLQLCDLGEAEKLLTNESYEKQKAGLRIASYDKPFYSRVDLQKLTNLVETIKKTFPQKGIYASKKQLLSSKEKKIWTCTCGKVNDVFEVEDNYCLNCHKDIYGFARNELTANEAIAIIENKTVVLNEHLA